MNGGARIRICAWSAVYKPLIKPTRGPKIGMVIDLLSIGFTIVYTECFKPIDIHHFALSEVSVTESQKK